MLSKAFEDLKFDVRMKDWNLMQKRVSPEELKAHLEKLPDLSDRAQKIKFGVESRPSEGNGAFS